MMLHKIVYLVFVSSILFDLATTFFCFQFGDFAETNVLYRLVGFWSFPIVLAIDALFLLSVEWLRKYIRWSPIVLFILIFAYIRAGIFNMKWLLGMVGVC